MTEPQGGYRAEFINTNDNTDDVATTPIGTIGAPGSDKNNGSGDNQTEGSNNTVELESEVDEQPKPIQTDDPLTKRIAESVRLAIPVEMLTKRIAEGAKEAYSDNSFVDSIAAGFIKAYDTLEPKIELMLVRVQQAVNAQQESEKEPDIEYDRRFHIFKVLASLIGFALTFVVFTSIYVLYAGNLIASLMGIAIVIIVLSYATRFRNTRVESTWQDYLLQNPQYDPDELYEEDDEGKKIRKRDPILRYRRLTWLALLGLSLVVFAIFIVIEELAGVNSFYSAVYLAISTGLLYFASRSYYMWAELRIIREGGILSAKRLGKDLYFLPDFNRELVLSNVSNSDAAQGWLGQKLGMYRLLITLDAEPPNQDGTEAAKEALRNYKFWTNLKYVIDGPLLKSAIRQATQQRRG